MEFLRSLSMTSLPAEERREADVCRLEKQWEVLLTLPPRVMREKHFKQLARLCWAGIPPSIRARAWPAIIGNELNITHQLFSILSHRAQVKLAPLPTVKSPKAGSQRKITIGEEEGREESLRLIGLDIPRTFPELKVCHEGGPLYDSLVSVLQAFVISRPDIGYVQGMSYLATMLVLNLSGAFEAYIAFANLLNKPLFFNFFRMDKDCLREHLARFSVLFRKHLPSLHAHLCTDLGITPDSFVLEWFLSGFSRSFPFDISHRIWDNFLLHGPEFLFQVAIGVLLLHRDFLLTNQFEECMKLLNRPSPLDCPIDEQSLFKCIERIKL